MPTSTFTALATITLSSTDTEIVFASIPNNFKDLIMVAQTRSTRTADAFDLIGWRANSDSASNYSYVTMTAGISSPTSESGTTNFGWVARLNTSSSGNTNNQAVVFQLMDYSATDKHKTALGRGAAIQEAQGVSAMASRWANTNAVNTLSFVTAQGSFASGSTFSLYGIAG